MSSIEKNIAERLRRYVRRLRMDDHLAEVLRILNGTGEAYLFGGAPRDVAFGAGKSVHDLDIIVSGEIDKEAILAHSTLIGVTNFGGLRLIVGKFDVDAWELGKSYAFRLDRSPHVSVFNLLRSVCFSTDGIAVSLKSGRKIASAAFLKSLSERSLDFVVEPAEVKPVIAARIVRLALKLELTLSNSVARYFMGCLDRWGAASIIDAEARWTGNRLINEISIEQMRALGPNGVRFTLGGG